MKRALLIIVPIIAIVVVGIALYYNNDEVEASQDNSTDNSKVTLGKYYFDFDEVVYYNIEIDDDLVYDAADRHRKRIMTKSKSHATPATDKDSLMSGIILDYLPESVNDAAFEKSLSEIGYTSKKISKDKFGELNEIFREKGINTGDAACETIYRDIFVFKKRGKVSGIAKLCYECGLSHFIGTNADTGTFGEHGEFEKLKEIVK